MPCPPAIRSLPPKRDYSSEGYPRMPEEYRLHLQIRRVENGDYLATSDDFPGLVAQGRTVAETVDIAQDVSRKLIESDREHGDRLPAGT